MRVVQGVRLKHTVETTQPKIDPEICALAKEVTRDIVDASIIDSVYLSGSLAASLGNKASDVDVFVVVRDHCDGAINGVQEIKKGTRFDIKFQTVAAIEDAVRKLTTWHTSLEDVRCLYTSPERMQAWIKLYYGYDIITSARLAKFRELLKLKEREVRQLVISWWAFRASCHYEDFKGACDERDADLAGIAGRYITLFTGKALAASAGDLYIGEKWVYRQLSRSLPDLPLRAFRHFMNAEWTANLDEGRRRLLWYAQINLMAAQTLGWLEPNIMHWPDWHLGDGPAKCRVGLIPVRLKDGIILYDEGKEVCLLNPECGLLWALAHGRDLDTYIRHATMCSAVCSEFSQLNDLSCMQARRDLVTSGAFTE